MRLKTLILSLNHGFGAELLILKIHLKQLLIVATTD
ncbi:hypothetical protein NOS3756_20940 [Nostoc sp. NIES-3756]|nr:hypothetical protein NOS3756_20940 [Nostoc sp. NIES-3756]BAY39139.1 hypothetical protein NIES2111_34890 [Nostoc sp. NIES-2111]